MHGRAAFRVTAWDGELGGPPPSRDGRRQNRTSLTVICGEKTHYAAGLMSAADQQIPGDTRVVLKELIMETGR